MRVLYYNRSEERCPLTSVMDTIHARPGFKVERLCTEANGATDFAHALAGADVAIFHGSPMWATGWTLEDILFHQKGQAAAPAGEERASLTKPEFVLLRISSELLADDVIARDYEDLEGNLIYRYAVNVVDMRGAGLIDADVPETADRWLRLLEAVRGAQEEIRELSAERKDREGVTLLRRRIQRLTVPKSRDCLAALALLCQGYLVAHREEEAAKRQLEILGWVEPMGESGLLIDGRSETEDPKWWKIVSSWGTALSQEVEDVGDSVRELIEPIDQGEGDRVCVQAVIDAYEELQNVLASSI